MTLNPLRAFVMTYSHAKVQGQRFVASEDIAQTDRRTEVILMTSGVNAVGKNNVLV